MQMQQRAIAKRAIPTWGARVVHKYTAPKLSPARKAARKPGPVTIIKPQGA